jgi:hypothetical protein
MHHAVMDHPVSVGPIEGMGVLHATGNLDRDVQLSFNAQIGPSLQHFVQIAAVHVFDEQPRHAADLLDVKGRADIGVAAERDPGLGFAVKTSSTLVAGENRRQRRLDRDHPLQLTVEGDVDHSHAASEGLEHVIATGDHRALPPDPLALSGGSGTKAGLADDARASPSCGATRGRG